jgi:sugar diacid utilization regulator
LTLERIGMPIRYERSLLGYLWLVKSDGPLSDQDAASVREAAGQIALILHREYLASEVARSRERELLRDLVSADASLRAEAADALIEEELVVAGPVSALVVTLAHERGAPLDEQGRLALHITVDHGRRRLSPGHAVTLNRPDHSLLLAIWPGARTATVDKASAELAAAVRDRLVTEVGSASAPTCWVGIGSTQKRLGDSHVSYLQARRAADVARITGALGTTVPYARLGVYALLAKLSQDELADGIHPGIRPLLGPTSEHHDLIETLQAYLDNAGDVQRTAAQLHIHRATLYYRLRRVEEVAGLDLARGDDRLAVHLSLKLAQLSDPD